MRLVCIAIVLALTAPASAMRLGRGYELVVAHREIFVARDHRKASLDLASPPDCVKIGKDRVTISVLTDCSGEQAVTFTYDQLEARLVAQEASEEAFARAARLDPTWQAPAFEGAALHVRRGDLAGGAAALAPWLASQPIATYVQVAQDPRLSALLAAPELARVRAQARGTVHVIDGRLDTRTGYSPELGLAAVEVEQSNGMSCDVLVQVELVDARRGKVVAELALSHFDGCGEHPDRPELDAPHRGEQVAEILDDLGIRSTPFEEGTIAQKDDGTRLARFPEAKLGVVAPLGEARVLRHDAVIATGSLAEPRLVSATYLPDLRLMVLGSYRPSDSCPDNAIDAIAMP